MTCTEVALLGTRPALNTQINRWSLPSLPAVVQLMRDEGATRWMPITTVPMGRGAENLDMLFQPFEIVGAIEALALCAERHFD